MRKILSLAIIFTIALWSIITIFVIIAALDKNSNPDFICLLLITKKWFIKN
jgi:hypothetical protein